MFDYLKQFTPSIVSALRAYNKNKFTKDLVSGIIVGVVALPLCIAFAIASGVPPEHGIITSVIAGFLTALFGGSTIGISGPTGAFIVVVYGVVQQYGIEGLAIATVISGVFSLAMGLLKIGTLIKFIPYPIVVGFTSGIALIIFSSQVKDVLGLDVGALPVDFIGKWSLYFQNLDTINPYSIAVSLITILLIIFIPKINKKIPALLVAIIFISICAFLAREYFNVDGIATIGDSFDIKADALQLKELGFNAESVNTLLSAGFTISVLGAIVSLLSLTVADGASGTKHNSNTELIGQGIANIVAPFFGAIPSTGAIARTMANISNGGITPIAGLVHSVVLLIILVFLGGLTKYVPMAALAGALCVISYNMSDWRTFKAMLKSPKADVIVLLVTFLLTVIFNLTIAIEVGLLLAVLLVVKRINDVSEINIIKDVLDTTDSNDDIKNDIDKVILPKGVEVYEINGPFFFGVANKFDETMSRMGDKPKVRIIRMRKVPFIDSTGLHNLEILVRRCNKDGITVILSGVGKNIIEVMEHSNFFDIMDKSLVTSNIHEALEIASRK